MIGSDPAFQPLWSARAACIIPSNPNTLPNTRITEFSYDIEGRLAQVNSPEGCINYNYDLVTGRHVGTCTLKSEMTYEYDALGRLWKVHAIKRNGSPISETTTYEYTEVGSRKKITLPNGIKTDYEYDNLNRLIGLTNRASDNSLLSQFSYQLHGTGRRTNATEIIKQESGSPTYQTNTMTWQYDGLYRLTNEVCISTVSGASYTNAFQYDKTGNRWSKVLITATATTTITNQYNANDQLLKEVTRVGSTLTAMNTYAYDANGSVIAKTNSSSSSSTVLYGYDLKNKMSNVTTAGSGVTNFFVYNEQGIRVKTSSSAGGNPTLYLVDGNNHTGYAQVLEELSTVGGTPTKSYVLGDDVLAQATSTASYLLYDGHGSTRQTADNTGAVTSRYNYDAYGTTLSSTSTTPAQTSLLYCGQQYESALGMYNLRARFYDPSNGRFNAMDSFIGNNFDPQSLHKYAYAHGDPVNGIDPSGHMLLLDLALSTTIRAILIGAVIGGIFAEAFYFIRTPMHKWSTTGALASLGKGAAAGAFGATLIGAAYFAAQGIYEGIEVWRNPNSTPLQKVLASATMVLSIAAAKVGGNQAKSQVAEWMNVYSKIPLKTEVQRDLVAIRQWYNAGNRQPLKVGNTTILFAEAKDRAGGVLNANEYYLTHEAFKSSDDFLMKTILEENIHIGRLRSGAAVGDEIAVGMKSEIAEEEKLVGQLVEDIFSIGRERTWW